MDEYKEYLYKRDPERYESIDAGDLTKQKEIREKLQCKPFKWFMTEIAFDLPKKYPPVEPPGKLQCEQSDFLKNSAQKNFRLKIHFFD